MPWDLHLHMFHVLHIRQVYISILPKKTREKLLLNITIKTNLTSVDFLDIRLNLRDNTYQPYRRPNSEPIYVNKSSNHPKNIIKDLPKAIGKRLSDTSCNQEVFEAVLPIYEEALKKVALMRSSATPKTTAIIHIKRKKKGDESAISSGLILLTQLM